MPDRPEIHINRPPKKPQSKRKRIAAHQKRALSYSDRPLTLPVPPWEAKPTFKSVRGKSQ
jgi:hypothetical protein